MKGQQHDIVELPTSRLMFTIFEKSLPQMQKEKVQKSNWRILLKCKAVVFYWVIVLKICLKTVIEDFP